MIYGYLRKSNEEGVNSSFDTQKYKIECYCNLHNLKVDEWFEDICSGGTLLTQRKQGIWKTSRRITLIQKQITELKREVLVSKISP